MPPATPTSTAKRKKWTEEEERALISKYSELQSSGALSRLRTREKKFRPIADHVTAAHHGVDPTAYPFSWSWKDACTKAHNMRHQYLLVKQKLLSAAATATAAYHGPDSSGDVNWADGLSLWPNFLRYKEVFGDAPLPTKPLDDLADLGFDDDEDEGGGGGGGGGGFDCDAGVDVVPAATAEDEERPKKMKSNKKNKKKKKKRRKVRVWEEEEEEKEEREWEERMERRRAEWRKRVEEMLGHHRLQMAQIQARVLNEQQAVIGQLLGLVSHWAGGGGGGGGGGGVGGSGYGAHVNGVAVTPGENRVGVGSGDGQEEQFILDG